MNSYRDDLSDLFAQTVLSAVVVLATHVGKCSQFLERQLSAGRDQYAGK